MRRVLTALLGALVVMAVAGFPIYVRPQQDPLRAADAVVVLGGSHSGARYQRGFSWPTPAGRTIWCCRIPTAGRPVPRPVVRRRAAPIPVRCFDPDPH
jgi:hypothetical protein